MARYEMDTKVYTDFAAHNVGNDFDMDVFLAVSQAYWAAESKAKAAWDAIPEGEAKDSAYENAEQMLLDNLFSLENRLAWYVAAVASYE